MISKARLLDWLVDNWVMFDKHGQRVDGPIPTDAGPAAFVVEPVTDALKRVEDGVIADSVDRDAVWKVRAVVLNGIVVERLPDEPLEMGRLVEVVRESGLVWDVSRTSGL